MIENSEERSIFDQWWQFIEEKGKYVVNLKVFVVMYVR